MHCLQINNLISKTNINYPNINFDQQVMGIIGPSGCGKSTLLKLLNASLMPKSGTILFDNVDIQELNILNYRRQVLLVNQNFNLYDGSIYDNFLYYYQLRDLKLEDNIIETFLSIVNLQYDKNTNINNLSGGEKQRVFLAICLSFTPKIILLDEPTSSLDEKTSLEVMNNIISFAKMHNMQIIMVSHNITLVNKICNEVVKIGKNE